MDHAGQHVVVVSLYAVFLSAVVKVAIEVPFFRLLLGVLFRPTVGGVEFAKQPVVLTSDIVFHFVLDLLPASGEALQVGFLLLLIVASAGSEGVGLSDVLDLVEVELEGLFVHVDVCHLGLSLGIEHANKYIYR